MSSDPTPEPNIQPSASRSKAGEKLRRQPRSQLSLDYRPHPGQQLFHDRAERFRIIAAGARWGKDTACLMELIRLVTSAAAETSRPKTLIPRVHAWVVGPSFPLLGEPWRVLKRVIPPSLIVGTNESRMSLELAGDIVVEFKSAERPESLVGSGLDVLCLLEAALIPEEAWTVSLRPRLANPGRWGLLIASGTPKGRNWFNRLYAVGQDPEQRDVWSLRAATWDNPLIDPAEIESMRDSMPTRAFSQEVAGEFVSDDGAVFRGVRSCIVSPQAAIGRVTVGCDWGTRRDRTALAAVDEAGHTVGFDSFRRIPWSQILDRVVKFVEDHRAQLVIPEINSLGDPLVEDLQSRLSGRAVTIQPFLTTQTSKREAIDRLALAIEQRRISFPDIPQLVNELELYEYSTSPAGNVRFNAPSGQFDDAVMALAFAWHGTATSGAQEHEIAGGYVLPDGWSSVVDDWPKRGTRA